jgi:hypothetical protein
MLRHDFESYMVSNTLEVRDLNPSPPIKKMMILYKRDSLTLLSLEPEISLIWD